MFSSTSLRWLRCSAGRPAAVHRTAAIRWRSTAPRVSGIGAWRSVADATEQTSDHRAHLHEVFLKIDENEDGMISRDELKSAIRESSITEVSRSSDVHASRLSQLRRHVHAARGGTRRHVPSGGPRRRRAHRLRRVCQGPGDLGAWSAVSRERLSLRLSRVCDFHFRHSAGRVGSGPSALHIRTGLRRHTRL